MKPMLLLLLLALSTQAAPRHWMAASACVLSAADFGATAYAAQHGARELNPLLANGHGGPALWRIGLLKVGMCGATVWAAKRKDSSMMLSIPQLAIFGIVTIRDIRELKK